MVDKISGKFQICLIVKEFVDFGDSIQLQPIGEYCESCWGWKEAKQALAFFMRRTEKKLKNGNK